MTTTAVRALDRCASFTVFTLALAVTLGAVGPVLAGPMYSLSILVESGQVVDGKTLTSVDPNFDRNDSGQVVFVADFAGGEGVFNINTLLAQTGDPVNVGSSITDISVAPKINGSGLSAYRANFVPGLPGTMGVFTSQAGLVVQNTDNIGGDIVSLVNEFDLNDSGDIIFSGHANGTSQALWALTGLLLEEGNTIDGKSLLTFSSPRLNSNGDILFQGLFSGGIGVFSPSSLLVEGGDTIDGELLTQLLGVPALSDSGEVVSAGMFGSDFKIFSLNQGIVIEEGDVIDGQQLTIVAQPSVNSAGLIAFQGRNASSQTGIYTPDHLVANFGESVDGKMLSNVELPVIDSVGNVAFGARFSDGSTGIVLGRLIPEPSTLAMVLVAASLTSVRVRPFRSC